MVINLKSQTDLSGFYIVYEGSTNLERRGVYGISHLSEHLFCKSYEHLRDEFERKGIDWNAYTSDNEIVFHFKGLDEYLSEYRDVVLKLLLEFLPTEEQFNNEKRIVIEEYKDCFNDQAYSHDLNLSRKLLNNFSPIGSLVDLESMTHEDMLDFINLQYFAPSKIINVSKHSDFNTDIIFNTNAIDYEIEYVAEHDTEYELGNEFKDKTSIILLSSIITKDFNYIKFLCEMLGGGLQSPLYQEVREKRGLAYSVQCHLSRFNTEAIIGIYVQTSNDKVAETIETIEMVLNDADKYLTQERFDIVRDWYIVEKKKAEINRYLRVTKWIEPNGWCVDDIIETITLDKVKAIYNTYFSPNTMYISTDKTEF